MFSAIVVLLFMFVTFEESKAALEKNKQIFCLMPFDKYNYLQFHVQNIKSEYCTHLIYGNVEIDVDGTLQSTNAPFDFGVNDEKGNIKIFNEKKESNKNLKTLILVGAGISSGSVSKYYHNIFKNEENQERFVESSIEFAIRHNFDGMLLNWRWSRTIEDLPVDKMSLNSVLKKLKPELEKRNMLLVLNCANFVPLIERSYDVEQVAKNVDYIKVDALNYYTHWLIYFGNVAELSLHPREHDKLLQADAGINEWIRLGAPSEKILITINLDGVGFALRDENKDKPGSPFFDQGSPSKTVTYGGRITYTDLCQKFSNESWTMKWEDTQKVPYAFKGDQWVGYENETSLELKAKYVIEKNLGGVVTNGQAYDDFRGLCGEKLPFHRILNAYLRPIEESRVEYIVNINVFERNLDDLSTQCIYHTCKTLYLE